MNCHTYTAGQPRAMMASAAVRTKKLATIAPFRLALSGLVGPGQVNSTGKARKEESRSDESPKLHCNGGPLG